MELNSVVSSFEFAGSPIPVRVDNLVKKIWSDI